MFSLSNNPWSAVIARMVVLFALAALVGAWLGDPVAAIALTAITYLIWHWINLYRLDRWLRHSRAFQPPTGLGIWSTIFDEIYRMKRRDRARKQRLVAILREFRRATAALPDGTVVVDRTGNIEWFNKAASRLLDLHYPHDLGTPLHNLLREPQVNRWLTKPSDNRPLIDAPAPRDERMRLSYRMVPYTEDQRLLLVRDVSELTRLEQVRQDFVANVSHELRTPLTVIAGYLEAIEGDAPETLEPVLAAVRSQAARMHQIVEDLLMLSRLDSGGEKDRNASVNMHELVDQLADDARGLSRGRHTITTDKSAPPYLRGNATELRSAFGNLVSNAVRYTGDGGRIVIAWRQADHGAASFTVTDSGCGIPPEDLPRITERFYRVSADRSRSSGGTGLGLAIVKNVLNRHQARLHVDSELGVGSTFACQFDAARVLTQAPEQSEGTLSAVNDPMQEPSD